MLFVFLFLRWFFDVFFMIFIAESSWKFRGEKRKSRRRNDSCGLCWFVASCGVLFYFACLFAFVVVVVVVVVVSLLLLHILVIIIIVITIT